MLGPAEGSLLGINVGSLLGLIDGDKLGNHAVKIIGWGSEFLLNFTTPYWLVANSWNTGF